MHLRCAFRPVLIAAVCIAPVASGCGFLDQELGIPIELATPPQDFDVRGAVTSVEEGACSDQGSGSCTALRAICETEEGRDCNVPTMPADFPAEVPVPAREPVAANQLMADMGITEATEMELALPVDVASALQDEGVEDPGIAKNVSIDALVMEWIANDLTFHPPPLDLYVARDAVDAGSIDAERLIAEGLVERVGTVGLDIDGDGEIDVGQLAGSTEPVPVAFVSGGAELLGEALKSANFTLVTAVPEGKGLRLKTVDGDETRVLKPFGQGEVSLKASLLYTVSAQDVIDLAP